MNGTGGHETCIGDGKGRNVGESESEWDREHKRARLQLAGDGLQVTLKSLGGRAVRSQAGGQLAANDNSAGTSSFSTTTSSVSSQVLAL